MLSFLCFLLDWQVGNKKMKSAAITIFKKINHIYLWISLLSPIRVLSYLVPRFPNDLLLGGSIPRTYLAKNKKKKKKTHSFEDRTGRVNKTSLTDN